MNKNIRLFDQEMSNNSAIIDKNTDYLPFEGAGFLLSFEGAYVFGKRLGSDQKETGELEYMGGKVEEGETPSQTAERELCEELGGASILDSNWQDRANIFHTFQPFSKKWIWIFRLELTECEKLRLDKAEQILEKWDATEKKFFNGQLCRKAISSIIYVAQKTFREYSDKFSTTHVSKNRMKDAKNFGKENKIYDEYSIRGFNLVIFEEHGVRF